MATRINRVQKRTDLGLHSQQGYFWSRIWMVHENRPMPNFPFICMQNQDFERPFEILMGHLEKKDGPKKP